MNDQIKEIKVGELGNEGNNSDILKEFFNIKKKQEELSDLIANLDTKIKKPRFEE